jgi:OOP family OmpA-OmpF porin
VPEEGGKVDPSPEELDTTPDVKHGPSEITELRRLLVGEERRRLEELERRLDDLSLTPEELADKLPDAVALRTARDKQLARSLAPTLQDAFGESVRRNPQNIAHAIFPILGPAIRKAIGETMAGIVNTINRAIEHSLSLRGLRWRIEAWRTGVPFAQIVVKHALVYRVEQVLLIHAETGLLLAEVTAEGLPAQDADIISSMMTAIRDFVQDSFDSGSEEGGDLRTFEVGEKTVLVEQGPQAHIAAVVSGQPPGSVLEQLQATLETIHLHFTVPLADFDGDATPFESTRPLLQESLQTVVATDRPARLGLAPRTAWVVAILVVVVLATLALRSAQRWRAALTLLENEPGIVLIEPERGWRAWRLSGLRDPAAAEPMRLLARMGVDTTRIETRWRPYVSFEPSLVLARANRTLDPPASVTLALGGDTLFAGGSATPEWIAGLVRSSSLPPGVIAVDVSGVTEILPPELAELKDEVEQHRVEFAIGSVALDATARGVLDEVATAFQRLRNVADERNYAAALNIVGRTDTTGSNETNRLLSQQRADGARSILAGRGIPGVSINAVGIGTSDPLSSTTTLDHARINRSVSFLVRVTFGTDRGGTQE